MPLSKIHIHPLKTGIQTEGCAKVQDQEPRIPVEGVVRVVSSQLRGERVVAVPGIRRSACRIDEERDGSGLTGEFDSRLMSFERQGEVGWRQQTLRLYDSLTPRLTQFLRRLGLSKDELDDVIQESFLRLSAHLREGNDDDNLNSWLYRVARNLAMDVHRASRRGHEEVELEFEPKDEPVDPKANPESVYLQEEQVRRLSAGMSQLTAQQYNSILLRTQGLCYREIGDLLGTSEQRAIQLVKRGLKRLIGGL